MNEHLDGDTLYASILMMQNGGEKSYIILVEGPEDCGLIDPHLDSAVCFTEIGHGKKAVLEAMRLVKKNQIEGVFAVVDRDFDDPANLKEGCSSISVSEAYDLHSELFFESPEIVDRLLANHTERTKAQSAIRLLPQPVPEVVIDICFPVGAVRLASTSRAWGVNLSKFPTNDLVSAYFKGELDNVCCTVAISRSPNISVTETDILAEIDAARGNDAVQPRGVCCGHDLASALASLFRRWGGKSGSDAIARSIRSATDCESFKRLSVFRDIETWGKIEGQPLLRC